MNHKKTFLNKHNHESISGSRPSEFMRARHPDLFSDSTIIKTFHLQKESFEYYLETITNRKQEFEFEYFCRRLAEKEICPNLIPQTGPIGGGDSQVDTETYPVADQIALRWYEGIGIEASNERWAFAFSAKKRWRSKVQSDIEKIANTNRGYQVAFFITNQFVRDRERVEVEENLKRKYGLGVRIFDRSWIVKCVYENDRIKLAAETLKIPGYYEAAIKQVGPKDTERQIELDELEEQINDPKRYQGVEYQLAEDCLDAALLARGLELPRIEIEGRFQRAMRIAERVGIKKQKLQILYNQAWTQYWWYEDYREFNRLYDRVEELAIGSEQADEVELLCNLWQNLHTAVKHGDINEEDGALIKRTESLKIKLDTLAGDAHRPNNALQSHANRLLLDLTEALAQKKQLDQIIINLKDILKKSEGLAEFSVTKIIKIIQELGNILVDSQKYDELLEYAIKITEKRTSEGEAGEMLLHRGLQKYKSGKNYDAIKLIGRAQQKLAMDEYKSDWITSLVICGLAYETVGLLWAARANMLMATNLAFSEFVKSGKLKPQTLRYAQRLVLIELQLGRLPHILAWMEFSSFLSRLLISEETQEKEFQDERNMQDQILAILLLNTDFQYLKLLDFLPTVLDDIGLFASWMTLLYTLGYEDYLRKENVIPVEESSEQIRDYFIQLNNQPVRSDLPKQPDLLNNSTVTLISPVLGCKVVITSTNNQTSLFLAENILGALEAFLATSFDSDMMPYRSELRIIIQPSDSIIGPPKYTINEKRQGEIDLRHSPEIKKSSHEERSVFREWLKNLILDITSQIALIPDIESFINQVINTERSFDRAIPFSDVEIAVSNLLGEKPKLQLSDWSKAETAEIFLLKRDAPWNHGITTQSKIDTEKTPLKFGEGEPPDSLFDVNRLRHKDRQILSLINVPLWEKAKWRAIGYAIGGGAPPLLAFCFEDAHAANQIFEEWKENLGEVDEKDKLRISIITGVNKDNPLNYKVVVTTNLENFDRSESAHFIITSRCIEMTPKTQKHLNYFLNEFKRVGKYFLVPARINAEEGYPEPIGNLEICKFQLFVHPAWQIGPNDPDVVAIQEGDDPFIPENEKNAPVLRSLNRFDKGNQRKRHKKTKASN